jgi:hypothetical protein
LVAAAAAARKGEGGAGELAAREGNFIAVAYCRASPAKARARARRSTKTPTPDCAECSAAVFVSAARNYAASAGGGYSARAVKKTVILAPLLEMLLVQVEMTSPLRRPALVQSFNFKILMIYVTWSIYIYAI